MVLLTPQWQWRHIILWLGMTGGVCWWQGPSYRQAYEVDFYPPGYGLFLPDFFQVWASARNRFEGLPVYTPHEITIIRYLRLWRNPPDRRFIEYNTHPPTSVLLAIPFAKLDFVHAFTLWSILSLVFLAISAVLILRNLELPIWNLLPASCVLLISYPFWNQMVHGQLSLLLLVLLMGIWAGERRGHLHWAGAMLGLASTIELFPLYLFVYFILRREWQAVRTGLIVLGGVTMLTAFALGPDAYRDYFLDVLPSTAGWRSEWSNLSLSGLWFKLFEIAKNAPPVEMHPLMKAPALALFGMACTVSAITAILVQSWPRLRAAQEWDLAFAITLIGMLIVRPVTRDHDLLMLLLPVTLLWQRWPRGGIVREMLAVLSAVLCVNPELLAVHGLILLDAAHVPNSSRRWIATPWETLTALSIQCYALVGLFGLAIGTTERNRQTISSVRGDA